MAREKREQQKQESKQRRKEAVAGKQKAPAENGNNNNSSNLDFDEDNNNNNNNNNHQWHLVKTTDVSNLQKSRQKILVPARTNCGPRETQRVGRSFVDKPWPCLTEGQEEIDENEGANAAGKRPKKRVTPTPQKRNICALCFKGNI